MGIRRMGRPSPAMIVAVVALSFALVGSAFAGTDALKQAITKAKVKQIAKKQANKVLNSRESSLNVNSANTASNANNLGGVPAAQFQREADLLYATVAPAGVGAAVVAGRGVTGVVRNNAGFFNVTFNRNITNCTGTATYGDPLGVGGGIDPKFATVRGPGGAGGTDTAGVVLWDDAGTQVDGDGFHIIVACP